MRRFAATVLAIASFCVVQSAAAATSYEFLSPAQKKVVLRAIDNVCGDTWCEGDYNFRFNQLYCSSHTKSCRVVFQYFPHGEPAKAKGAACDVHAVSNYVQLVNARTKALIDRTYQQLSTCISRIEARR